MGIKQAQVVIDKKNKRRRVLAVERRTTWCHQQKVTLYKNPHGEGHNESGNETVLVTPNK